MITSNQTIVMKCSPSSKLGLGVKVGQEIPVPTDTVSPIMIPFPIVSVLEKYKSYHLQLKYKSPLTTKKQPHLPLQEIPTSPAIPKSNL